MTCPGLLSRCALALLLVAGCGGRSPTDRPDAAGLDSLRSDGKLPTSDDRVPGLDGCVRPPGGCFSTKDCPAGQECRGCGADPCCPMCAVCYGKCEPATPGLCTSNAGCKPGELCVLDGVCQVTGGKGGECKPRPQACPEYYSPTCGCDGKTYGNECEAHAAGVSVKHKGACPQTCADMEKAYAATLPAAKVCCPMCDSIQCAKKVKSSLGCPCETYVHATNTAALQMLSALEQQWAQSNCVSGCPPVPCPALKGATCEGASSTGTCKDLY
jgi:hypothetical protein